MIVRSRQHLEPNGMPTPEMLASVIAEHEQGLRRLKRLKDYYMGNSDINRRTRPEGMPNNRIAHPFARYITAVSTGYLIGQPVAYSTPDDSGALEQILDAYRRASISSVDAENARNAAIYGRGIEYVYLPSRDNSNLMPRASALNPETAFVVYADSYEVDPLFGVYYMPELNPDGSQRGWRIWVMSDTHIAQHSAVTLTSNALQQTAVTPHFFGGVPLVEYWNDESEYGDFEWIIPLIDAYDKLESDRVNDKEQFVNAMLVLTGCTLAKDERGRTPAQQLREDRMLSIPDSGCDAKYLSHSLDEANTEVVRAALVEDIHKLSMVPNLADKEFAANASGVAMRYKLWGLEQLTNVKQQWFTEGLRQRLKLFANFINKAGYAPIDVADVEITFTRALPENTLEQAQIAQAANAANAASIEMLVRILHKGENMSNDAIAEEVTRILEQKGMELPDPLDPRMGDYETPTETVPTDDEVSGE